MQPISRLPTNRDFRQESKVERPQESGYGMDIIFLLDVEMLTEPQLW